MDNTSQNGAICPQGGHCDIDAFELDNTPLTVLYSVLADTNPAGIGSVIFTVIFSEAVTGVDAADFTLSTTGVSGASITGVSGSGNIYTVNVNTGSGNGTIRLDVPDSVVITDLAGNASVGPPFMDGETYKVVKIYHYYFPIIFGG